MSDESAIFLMFCFLGLVLFFGLLADIAPESDRNACEANLPRDQRCVWVAVPEKEVKK